MTLNTRCYGCGILLYHGKKFCSRWRGECVVGLRPPRNTESEVANAAVEIKRHIEVGMPNWSEASMSNAYNYQNLWGEVERRKEPFDWNVYDLLRKLVMGGSWTEEERAAAVKLVDTIEAVGVFGSSADQIREKGEG